MHPLWSSLPAPELRPYVRAFAQRKLDPNKPSLVEIVPAQLEQVLNFELGPLPGVRHRLYDVSSAAWFGGAQTTFPGTMDLRPGAESFAIFFQPLGWSQLFGIPAETITNHIFDATLLMGRSVHDLWNALGEAASFELRVSMSENFLRDRLFRIRGDCRMTTAATQIFEARGALRISSLARQQMMSLRQFEREFHRSIGTTPKTFARVARFQAALDAKLAAPRRSWLEIAHFFGYHDQMHMVHDFHALSQSAPNHLIEQMGDVRPPALASA